MTDLDQLLAAFRAETPPATQVEAAPATAKPRRQKPQRVRDKESPLRDRQNRVAVTRRALFREIGFGDGGYHQCHGCATPVRWMLRIEGAPEYSDELQAVALDRNSANVCPANLAPMCPTCSKEHGAVG